MSCCRQLRIIQNFFDTPAKKPPRGPYCGANTPDAAVVADE